MYCHYDDILSSFLHFNFALQFYGYSSSDEDSLPDGLEKIAVKPPIYSFTEAEFVRRHGRGTRKEFLFEAWEIEKINSGDYKYEGWLIAVDKTGSCLIFVRPGKYDSKIPKEGEKCTMSLYKVRRTAPHKTEYLGCERSLEVERVDNLCRAWGIKDEFWEKCMAFHVRIPSRNFKWIGPVLGEKSKNPVGSFPDIARLDGSKFGASFKLRVSSTTVNMEIGAMDTLLAAHANKTQGQERQAAAFSYLMNFQQSSYVSLFNLFPQLPKDPHNPAGSSLPPKLIERLQRLDSNQVAAWTSNLAKCPDRICFVPGGPGAGKTFWNLTLAASLQTKVLYLLDINRPLTDVANKMLRLCKEMYGESMKPWSVIRLFYWGFEKRSVSLGRLEAMIKELSHREKLASKTKEEREVHSSEPGPLKEYDTMKEKQKSDKVDLQGFSTSFEGALRLSSFASLATKKGGMDGECQAPTIDDAAAAYYMAHKDTRYGQIVRMLLCTSNDRNDLRDLEDHLVGRVYRDVLAEASFIATTPVTAGKISKIMYDAKVVIFDEAPHARELSIMIPIAKFTPEVWILTGDPRQTKPYVGSLGNRPNINEYVEQLRVSTMERACLKQPNMPALLVNHRAKAGLEGLASDLFYNSTMVPAVDPSLPGAIPSTTLHLIRKYIMPLKRGKGPEVPRLLVVLDTDERATKIQTSFYHPAHQDFTMRLIRKLVRDKEFLQTNGRDRGTILVMSHYSRAFIEYGKAIRDLARTNKDCLVEARTIDTSQGHEADFVILDFVNDKSTKHLEDPNRLCVGLTRARQAEILIMTEGMMSGLSVGRFEGQRSLNEMVAYCKREGQYVKNPNMRDF